jgi:hypothetical protein
VQPFAADLSGAPPIDSPTFWAQPFRVPASADPDTATAQTISLMCGHVRKAAVDGHVVNCARNAVSQFGGLGPAAGLAADVRALDARSVAGAAFWWCKIYVHFVHHEFIIRQRLGESGHLQGLISPEVLVRMDRPEGDCAIFSECVAAFLTVFGIPYEFVTAAVNPSEPETFSHVYLYAVLADGSRLPLDASHGQYPGWQVPSAHVSRRQVWDADGNPVQDRGSRFDGLHNYGLRGGLGDGVDPQTGESYGPAGSSTTYLDYTSGFPVAPNQYIDQTGSTYIGSGYVAPASNNSAQWATFASNLVKSGLTLAEINAIQPGTVVGANGQILRQNPGYAVGTPTGAVNLGGISTPMLMLGGLALAAILFMGRK